MLEGLKPHNGLQAIRIESYGGTTFPTWMVMSRNMVEIHLSDCKKLRWLFSCDTSITFPNLKVLTLRGLECLEGLWEITNEEQNEEIIFPQLEKMCVIDCPKLTMKAKAPKLTRLDFEGGEEELFLWVARYLTSLTNLNLQNRKDTETTSAAVADHSYTQVVNARGKWNHHDFPLADLQLTGFKSGVTELCACFKQLQQLIITDCAALVHWPEKEFQSLVSLRSLEIFFCKQLVGYAHTAAAEPSTVSEPSSQLLPHLEYLWITDCGSMVEIFKLPVSLRIMGIMDCNKLKSIFSRSLQQGESAVSILQSPVHSEVLSSSAITRVKHFPVPCLEEIVIERCDSLTVVLDLPPSLKIVAVSECCEFRLVESHSGEFPSLESLDISDCKTMSSLPDGPQSYASLKYLRIRNCPGIKRLPAGLRQHLSSIEEKDLDARYQEPTLLKPKTWRNAFRRD